MTNLDRLMKLLGTSYSQFHAVRNMKAELINAGFIEVKENDNFNLYPGNCYFVTRNDSSIIAFKIPEYPAK